MSGRGSSLRLALAVLCGVLLVSETGRASSPFLEVPPATEMVKSPAYVYANSTNEDIRALIAERHLPFSEVDSEVPGVRLPGRLVGPLHGVWVHGTDPRQVSESPYEILDGRLALALDDFCKILEEAEIIELLHFTILRPVPHATSPLTRHGGALAIDVGALRRKDGTWLRVKREWSPAIGAATCGPGAQQPASEAGQLLKSWVCKARERGLFHYALTPHFNAAHADHLHLELKPQVRWFLYN